MEILGVCAPNAASGIDLVLYWLGLARPDTDDARQIDVLCCEQVARHITIDGLLADIELIGVVSDDVVRRLPLLKQGADKFV